MHLDDLNGELFGRVVRLYLDIAWDDLAETHGPCECPPSAAASREVLSVFQEEKKDGQLRKYTLRLGNRRYPFMKIVLQELFLKGLFFFAVDTHDELDLADTFPDYQEWLDIKRYNADVKARVERSWAEHAVPTFTVALDEVERSLGPERQLKGAEARTVFVVDDDRDIARGVEAVLSHRGYTVAKAHSGEEALETLKTLRPDLILADFQMGEMNGLELAKRLRKNVKTRSIPFILATAASLDPAHLVAMEVINGFLVKPFDKDVLLAFVEKLAG